MNIRISIIYSLNKIYQKFNLFKIVIKMNLSGVSLIQTNERILKKIKFQRKRAKRKKYLKINLCYGLILIGANILLLIFMILFRKKSSNNKGIKYIINKNNIKNNQ
jgi:hypothetical protein